MSRKEKSRIDTSGGQGLGDNPFAQADAFGALDRGLLPAAAPTAAKPDASKSAGSSVSTTSLGASSGAAAAVGSSVSGSRAGGAAPAASVGKPGSAGRLNVRWEKSGRGGKAVTLLYGEAFDNSGEAELDALLKSLKNRFGCGGTRDVKTLELQGRLVEQVMPVLVQMGYRVVRSGG